jgi:uncharacterized membrane protein
MIKKIILGAVLFCVGYVGWQQETEYFGNNKYSQSFAEAVADAFVIVIMIIGIRLMLARK